MSPEGLQIRMGADVSRAIAGLKQVETAMQKTVSNSKSFEASVGKSGQALGKIVNPSNQATLALTNLGRVAQDAPFGFLGIANNLNPLLESFQRLKATTGTTGGALKALASSLTGAGGIGLALSVVSSLAIVFGGKLFSAGKAAKEASEETKKYADAIKSATSSIADESAKVQVLISYIKLESTSRLERVNAIKELQRIAPSYFATLNAETATIGQVTAAYNLYVSSLRRAIEAKVLEKQLSEVIEKRLSLQKTLNQPLEEEILINGKLVKVRNAIYDKDGEIKRREEEVVKLRNTELLLADKLAKIKPPLVTPKDFAAKEVKIKPEKVTIEKAKFTDFSQLGFDIIPPDEFKPVATSAATLFSKEFTEYFKKPGVIDFSLIQAVNDDKLNKETKDLAKDLGTNFSQSFRDAINSGISSIGEGIGNVLSGQDFGSSITDAFSGLLSSLGKALIEYGLIKEGLDKILGPGGIAIPGAVAIGLGVLAIAASTALKNIGGARASGGPVAGNTPYLVGERGPEIFTPSVSGSIIPNNQIGSFSGRSQMATIRVTGRLRGNDMILQNARTNRMQTRLG
jgi:hypothetical protein